MPHETVDCLGHHHDRIRLARSNELLTSCPMWTQTVHLIEIFPASFGTTVARYLDILDWKLVVVGELLANVYSSTGKDYNVFLVVHLYYFGETIRLQKESEKRDCIRGMEGQLGPPSFTKTIMSP